VDRATAERAWVVYRAGFGVALYCAVTTYSLWLIDHGYGALSLALLGTTLEVAYTLSEVPTGVLADRHSRRLSLVVGLVLSGLATFLVPIVWLPSLLLLSALWGVGWTCLSGADVAWITDEVGEEAARPLYASGQRAELLGSAAGIGVGAALGAIALWVPLVGSGVLFVALGLWLHLRMPETAPPRTREDRPTVPETLRRVRAAIRGGRGLGVVLAMMFALGIGGEGVDRMWQLHLVGDRAGERASVLVVSSLFVAGLLAGALATGFVERVAHEPRRWLTIANAGVAASVVALAVAPWWLGATGLVVSMAVRSASHPLVVAWVNRDADPASRATLNSVVGQSESIGEIVGGPLLGGIAAAASVGAGLVVAAAMFAAAALTTTWPRGRRAPT
jgi:DHA3 family tetracycline resistance protein-like MFS transporter